jgi:hypothetical protein
MSLLLLGEYGEKGNGTIFISKMTVTHRPLRAGRGWRGKGQAVVKGWIDVVARDDLTDPFCVCQPTVCGLDRVYVTNPFHLKE